jgi:hypothetical protein
MMINDTPEKKAARKVLKDAKRKQNRERYKAMKETPWLFTDEELLRWHTQEEIDQRNNKK